MFQSQRVPVINEISPNTVVNFNNFHLSFNNRTGDYGAVTTAFVVGGNLFFILNGDHREAMNEAAQESGIQGAFGYFLENISQANFRSEHLIVGTNNDTFGVTEYAKEFLGEDSLDRIQAAMTGAT